MKNIKWILSITVFLIVLGTTSLTALALNVLPAQTYFNLGYGQNQTINIILQNNDTQTDGIIFTYNPNWFQPSPLNLAISAGQASNATLTVFGFRGGYNVVPLFINYSNTSQEIDFGIQTFLSINQSYLCPPGNTCLNSTDILLLLNTIASSANATQLVMNTFTAYQTETNYLLNLKDVEIKALQDNQTLLKIQFDAQKNVTSDLHNQISKLQVDIVWKGFLLFCMGITLTAIVVLSRQHWKRFTLWIRDRIPFAI